MTVLTALEIPASLAEKRDDIRRRCNALSDEQRGEFERGMDITLAERFAYQNAQARAFATGRIPADIARYLYRAIGEAGSSQNGGWPSSTTLADKVVVTLAISELVS